MDTSARKTPLSFIISQVSVQLFARNILMISRYPASGEGSQARKPRLRKSTEAQMAVLTKIANPGSLS